jgi:hypothetical protein
MSSRRDWNRPGARRGHWSTRQNNPPKLPAWKDREPMLTTAGGTLADLRRQRAAERAAAAINGRRPTRRRTVRQEAEQQPRRSRVRKVIDAVTGHDASGT